MDHLAPILSADEMKAWDQRAISTFDLPERVLLESAGRAAAARLASLFPDRRFLFLIGKGNNGGDGIVAARTLHAWGRRVACLSTDAGVIERRALTSGWQLESRVSDSIGSAAGDDTVLVDALLGTGVRDAPREPLAALIREANERPNPVVSLDTPSGVDVTTGRVPGDAVRAVLTLSFGALKSGHLREPGRSHAGALEVLEIGFPPLEDERCAALVTDGWAAERIPLPPPDAHKGVLGRVMVVAGTAGMAGAAIMIAHGALRAGAGLVSVVSSPEARASLNAAVPEVIVRDDDADLEAHIADADCVVIGPGLGTSERSRDLLQRVAGAATSPLVLDADALTLLAAGAEDFLDGSAAVLTPHPGEAARLLSTSVSAVTEDPWSAARSIAARYRAGVLLKGRPSVVAAPDRRLLVIATGHSGVASGGMGDTLSGITGALIGRGMSPAEAAACATHLSGCAAELAGRGSGLLPRDVSEALPEAERRLREQDGWGRGDPGVLLRLPRSH